MHQTGWSWADLDATPETVLVYYEAIGAKAQEIRSKTPS